MTQQRNALTRRWLIKAKEDLAAARRLAADPPLLGAAIFHCQQLAEKSLKALLVFDEVQLSKREFETHNLTFLIRTAAQNRPELKGQFRQAARLNGLDTAYRYPFSVDDDLQPSRDRFEQALSYATDIYRTAISLMPQEVIGQQQAQPQPQVQPALWVAEVVNMVLSRPDPKVQRQPDGSVALQGKSFEYRKQADTVSLIARDGRGEILRVNGDEVEVDNLTGQDLEKCRKVQEQILAYQQAAQQKDTQQQRGNGPVR